MSAAIDFLTHLRPEGIHNLVSIDPVSRMISGITRKLPEGESALRHFIETCSDRNLYYSINEPKPDAPGGKLKNEHIARVEWLVADLDAKDGRSLADIEDQLSALPEEGFAPTCIVFSGGGYQCLWRIDPAGPEDVKRQNRGIAQRLGGDSTIDAARIFRLPGTTNYPDARKRSLGRTEAAAELVRFDAGIRYTLDQAAAFAAPIESTDKPLAGVADFDVDIGEALSYRDEDDLPVMLYHKLRRAKDDYPWLGSRWDGETEGMGDTSRSGFDFHLAGMLRHAGFTAQEIANCLAVSKHASGEDLDYRRFERAYARSDVKPGSINPALAFTVVEGLDVDEPSRGLNLVSPAALYGAPIPEREWLVDPLIPHGTVCLFTGDGGLGKSLLMQQLATDASLGRNWLGLTTRHCRTFALFCEDSDDELHRRQAKICQSLGLPLSDVPDFKWLSAEKIDPAFMMFGANYKAQRTEFFYDLMDELRDWMPELVILDTAADIFVGNENERSPVRQFIASLRRMAHELDATVILAAHPSNAGKSTGTGLSGSTAWSNSVRSRLYLRLSDEHCDSDGTRILESKKSNYGPTDTSLKLVWRNGVLMPVQSVVSKPMTPEQKDLHDEAVYLTGLMKIAATGERVVLAKNQRHSAIKTIGRLGLSSGITQSNLERAEFRLRTKKVIAVDESGPPSKRQKSVVIADDKLAWAIIGAAEGEWVQVVRDEIDGLANGSILEKRVA